MYEYRMIQIPPNITLKRGATPGTEAAAYLQGMVNQECIDGWEFYRIDTIGVKTNPGCLGAFSGQTAALIQYYVVTFRRPRVVPAPQA